MGRRSARGRLLPQAVIVCHLERSEASAERSRKTRLLFRSDEKQIAFPVRAAKAQTCAPRSLTKFNGNPRLRAVVEMHICSSSGCSHELWLSVILSAARRQPSG